MIDSGAVLAAFWQRGVNDSKGPRFRAELVRFPDKKLSVICLANLGTIEPTALALQVADLYLPKEQDGSAGNHAGTTTAGRVMFGPYRISRLDQAGNRMPPGKDQAGQQQDKALEGRTDHHAGQRLQKLLKREYKDHRKFPFAMSSFIPLMVREIRFTAQSGTTAFSVVGLLDVKGSHRRDADAPPVILNMQETHYCLFKKCESRTWS